MANTTNESFQQAVERISKEPSHVEVPVKKIELDLSLPGILARVQFLAGEAHKKGNLVEDKFKEIMAAADRLKDAVSHLDPKQLLQNLPGLKGKK
jgi:hypothetical protein